MELTVGSLFAGVGGICLGFMNARNGNDTYRMVFANEMDEYACETYRTNFSHTLLEGDIKLILHPENSKEKERYQALHDEMFKEPVDVLNGGFPCLTADTLVFTKNGYVPIVEVKPGDMVLSHDNQWHKVLRFMEQGVKRVYQIMTMNDKVIKATGNHRFYVRKRFRVWKEIVSRYIEVLVEPEWMSVSELTKEILGGGEYTIGYFTNEDEDISLLDKNEIKWAPIQSMKFIGEEPVYDIEVEDSHSFVANGLITHNCQAFSVAGQQRGFSDDRGNLFLSIVDVINQMDEKFHKKPRILFLENVKNLKNHDKGRTYQVIKNKLEECGYIIKDVILNTMNYSNIPQNRERIYIIGFLRKEDADRFTMPEHVEDFKVKVSTEERTEKVKSILDETVSDDVYFYTAQKYPHYFEEVGKPIKKKERVNIAEQILEKNEFYQLRRGLYVRKNMNHVCPTLTANMGTGGHNVPLILTDKGIRKLTPTEAFKLQGFPIGNGYVLPTVYHGKPYGISHLYKQAGNAVSVPVITLLANEILKACKDV